MSACLYGVCLQVMRGGHPNWLAEDQVEVEARRQNAVEDRLQDLDRELNEMGEDAQRRRNHPRRVELERQMQETTNRINEEVARFESLSQRLHNTVFSEYWLQEMELIHQLGVNSPRFDVAVGCAQERLQKWREQGGGARESDVPEYNFGKPSFSSDGELDQVDLRLIRIAESPAPLEMTAAERKELKDRLTQVRERMSEAQARHEVYLEMALRCLRVTDDETDEELPLLEFHPEEQVCWWEVGGAGVLVGGGRSRCVGGRWEKQVCWWEVGGAGVLVGGGRSRCVGGRREEQVCWWEVGGAGVLVGGGRSSMPYCTPLCQVVWNVPSYTVRSDITGYRLHCHVL